MKRALMLIGVLTLGAILVPVSDLTAAEKPSKEMHIRFTEDFEVTGDGSNAAWKKAASVVLSKRETAGHAHETTAKVLYSKTGFYVLMEAADRKLTATLKDDFLMLWKEDVFEFFVWPDERHPVYFEYEISPFGYELPILIPNFDGKFFPWQPWMYAGDRKTRKATSVQGGKKESGATITGWKAEIFVPYELLKPLENVPPKPGTRWRANFYRMDYDDGVHSTWDWSRVGKSFHEFRKFGTWVFE